MKNSKFYLFLIGLTISLFFFTGVSFADVTPPSGEEELFTSSNTPDALILLDLSGSMDANPTGDSTYTYGHSTSCFADATNCVTPTCTGWHCTPATTCSGGFCRSAALTNCNVDCSKLAIAKRVVFNVLDETNDSSINSDDATALGVRFGYMRFINCSSSSLESTRAYGSTSSCVVDKVNCHDQAGYTCGRTDGFCNTSIPAYTLYAHSTGCTADTVNCPAGNTTCGRTDGFCNTTVPAGTIYYSSSSCTTADKTDCTGSACGRTDGFCNSPLAAVIKYYAANTDCTADTTHCTGTGCGRYDGFCNSAVTGPTFYAAASCGTADPTWGNCNSTTFGNCGRTDGFCNRSENSINYYAAATCGKADSSSGHCRGTNCSSGFCTVSKTGCSVACTSLGCTKPCSTPCNNPCYTPGCQQTCTTTGCSQPCEYPGCNKDCIGAVTTSWSSGCNTLIAPIGTLYSCIYCSDKNQCPYTTNSACYNTASVSTETAVGGTHLAAALDEAKLYLDDNKAADPNAACRKKFVILLTDGEDTLACSGDGTEDQSDQYKRRRESVAYAKKLADAGYKVFVIGFGQNMPDYLRNTLNWMAYYGGTDNPNLANSGSVSAYAISTGLYPSGISSCQAVSTPDPGNGSAIYNTDGTVTLSGTYPLGGYAFFAADADTLAEALRTAINIIRESTYSFTQASVQSSRTSDENYIYEASFEPILDDPFWHGHLKKYLIKPDGTVGGLVTNGDAAANLEVKDGSSRTMKTYVNGSLITFNTSIDPAYFGYNSTDTASRDAVVGYIRGLSPSGGTVYDPDSEAGVGIYKLGDVFRSTPITVATPSYFFNDNRDSCTSCPCTATNTKSQSAFASFRSTHCRASSCSSDSDQAKRLVVVGANDGQLHAFKTMGLSEAWSFIPPNLLPKLNMITHSTHPTTLSHEYYVDGQITVADVWLGTGDGTCKNAADWTTLLVFGEGRGTKPNTWSQSQYCDSYFNSNSMYDSTNYPYYCGYYALNLNDSLNPAYMWHITGSSTDAIEASLGPYFGDAWSKMMIGRVMYNNGTSVVEKWAGFIGAGYNGSTCTVTTSGTNGDCRGKGFFVIDLSNGRILWSFTIGSSDTKTTGKNMKYSVPSDAAIVDIDGDGFVDTAYIGDLGGNIWRSKFCKAADSTSCAITSWSGTRLFDGTTLSPVRLIYSAPAVTRDDLGNIWVYWGTGDKNDPLNISSTYTEKVFGLKDNNPASPYGIDDLKNITTSTFDNTSTAYKGYYINLATGEKMLAEPVAFGGVIYFTTYTPPGTSTTSCTQNGTAKLYGINYTTGAGVFDNGNRSINIGSGIPSAPVVSMEPGGTGIADIYVTVSGGYLDTGKNTGRVNFNTPGGPSNMTNILFWKDRRLE